MFLCWVHGHIVPLVLSKRCVGFGVGGAFVFAFPSLIFQRLPVWSFGVVSEWDAPGRHADFAGLFLGM